MIHVHVIMGGKGEDLFCFSGKKRITKLDAALHVARQDINNRMGMIE